MLVIIFVRTLVRSIAILDTKGLIARTEIIQDQTILNAHLGSSARMGAPVGTKCAAAQLDMMAATVSWK